jgi:uncharacterized membrane protein SpoIIM required for sporulation
LEEREFVAGSRPAWERLAASVTEARAAGVTRLGASRLRQMHEDYRSAAADLAYAQTHFAGGDSATYLNRLVGQAHGELYGSAPRRAAAIWRFLAVGYPRLLRASWRPIALAAVLLCGTGLIGYIVSYTDYSLARIFLPEQLREGIGDTFGQTKQANASLGRLSPVLSAYIGVNNVWVAVVAFAGGMTANLSLDFWALIVPHGSIELPAIIIAGGAGLRLAGALVFPGDAPRMNALKTAAPQAVRLMLGTVPMFAIAAMVEGFFTPQAVDPLLKLAVGGVLAALLAVYWGFAGREPTAI